MTLEDAVEAVHAFVHAAREQYGDDIFLKGGVVTLPVDSPIIECGITSICGAPLVPNPESELEHLFED